MKNCLFQNKYSFLKFFFSNIAHIFLNLFKNFKTGVDYKRLAYNKRPNSNLIADRSNFLANKTVRLVLELYV